MSRRVRRILTERNGRAYIVNPDDDCAVMEGSIEEMQRLIGIRDYRPEEYHGPIHSALGTVPEDVGELRR